MRTFRVALLLAVLAGDLAAQDLAAPSSWPTDTWVESPPEAQGLSSSDLADALVDVSLPPDPGRHLERM